MLDIFLLTNLELNTYCPCQQLGCGEIMFNALGGLCTGSSSVSLGRIVTAESYSLLYSFQSPRGSPSSSYEGAVCAVFKMVLQPNTCELTIQHLALARESMSTGLEIYLH